MTSSLGVESCRQVIAPHGAAHRLQIKRRPAPLARQFLPAERKRKWAPGAFD